MAASLSIRLRSLLTPRLRSLWTPALSRMQISSQPILSQSLSPHSRLPHSQYTHSHSTIGSPLLQPLVLPFGPSIAPSKNVYIACLGGPPGCSLFINCVDVEYGGNPNGGFSLLHPKFLLFGELFHYAAFCIFESTLYVFEGFRSTRRSGLERRCSYSYEFEPRVTCLEIEESMMQDIGYMISIKYCPMAVPTPDGENILIFSCDLSPEYYFDFELFNPETRRYQKLPPLPCHVEDARIEMHTFLSKYVLLVKVNAGCWKSCYILDFQLHHHDRCWKICSSFFDTHRLFLGHNPLILGKSICLTSTEAYEIDLECQSLGDTSVNIYSSGLYCFPEESSLDDDFVPKSITLIEENVNGLCKFCILRTYTKNYENVEYIPHFVLDVYQCDLNACREGMKGFRGHFYGKVDKWDRLVPITLPGTKKIKSLSFCVPEDGFFDEWYFSSYNGFI